MISIKKHFGTTQRRYLYLSGWMVAALRSEFGPLPDQSMHEKTSVPALIAELYTFLRQADARELGDLFRELDAAREPRRLRDGDAADLRASTPTRPTSCRSSPTSTPASATPRRPTCWPSDDRGRRLRAADREPGLRREAVRPPGRQGHRPARGLPGQDPRLPLRLPRARHRGRHHRRPHRLAGRRPHQADRGQPHAGRPRRPVQLVPRLRGGPAPTASPTATC